jgi:hypothetical protein
LSLVSVRSGHYYRSHADLVRYPQLRKADAKLAIHPGLAGASMYRRQTGQMLTLYGAAALTFMMLMYALEQRDRRFILAFGCGCLLSSAYGFLAGVWPFGVVEVIWAGIAFSRYRGVKA